MNPYLSTLLHTLEIVLIIAIVWGVTQIFPGVIPNDTIRDTIMLALIALSKFARASDSVPIPDFVNGKTEDSKTDTV